MNLEKILVTGGAGFIGSHFVKLLLSMDSIRRVVVLDKLTYAGNPANLDSVRNDPRFEFIQGDICDSEAVNLAMDDIDSVVNFAAETHVDRSLLDPEAFIRTDVLGTHVLLECAHKNGIGRYLQVSTDEVYGPLTGGSALEKDPLRPSSPYSASKASGDLLTLAYHTSFGVPTLVTRGCNTYGPNQYPEKLIPLFVTNALENKMLPLYGTGLQYREWIHAVDHCRAIWTVLEKGDPGNIYNIGTGEERTNLSIAEEILFHLRLDDRFIQHVQDRAGHDVRYSINNSKLKSLGWKPDYTMKEGLPSTIDWYKNHPEWWGSLKSGGFLRYYRRNYRS